MTFTDILHDLLNAAKPVKNQCFGTCSRDAIRPARLFSVLLTTRSEFVTPIDKPLLGAQVSLGTL